MKTLFIKSLKCYNEHTASYYAITLPSRNTNSLAHALDLSTSNLHKVLAVLGLARWRKKKNGQRKDLILTVEKIKTFFVANDIGLGGDTYIDKSCSPCARQAAGTQLLFRRLGKPYDTNKTDRAFDQGYQYCAPSLHERELECISKHARDMEPLLRSIERENECSDVPVPKITPVKRKRTSISSSVRTDDDADETMEEASPDISRPTMLTPAEREMIMGEVLDFKVNDYLKRMALAVDDDGAFEDIPLNAKEMSTEYGLLKMLRIPFQPKILQVLLGEIIQLSESHRKPGLLSITTSDTSTRTMILLPKLTSKPRRSFCKKTRDILQAIPLLMVNLDAPHIKDATVHERNIDRCST